MDSLQISKKLSRLRLPGIAASLDQRTEAGKGGKMGLFYIYRNITYR